MSDALTMSFECISEKLMLFRYFSEFNYDYRIILVPDYAFGLTRR